MDNLTPDSGYRTAVTVEYRDKNGPATGPEESTQAMSMSTRRALLIDNAPPPPSADFSIAFSAPLSATAADTLRAYRGSRAPLANDPLFVETGANTRLFVGQWLDDHGQTVTAHLQLGAAPTLDPDREEWLDAVLTWMDGQQQSHRVEGVWKEAAPAAGWFSPEEFFDPDAPRELRVQSVQALGAGEPLPPRPVLVKIEGLPSDTPAADLDVHLRLGAREESLARLPYDGGGWFLTRPSAPTQPSAILGALSGWQSPGDEVRLLGGGNTPGLAATTFGATPMSTSPSALALEARAQAAGNRGTAAAQAYLEAEGYYDEDPPGPADREPLTMDELRGWTLLAFGRPAYLAMILFEEKRGGVVEFVDVSWWSPLKKMRGYELSKLNEPLKIQIDANLEPLRAAEVFMEALTDFLGQSPTREEINLLYAETSDSRFTTADREMLTRSAFRAAWTGQLGKMETLIQAQEVGIRIVFAPVDMVVTVFEAVEGDRVALAALAVAVTPIDNVVGVARRIVKAGAQAERIFDAALLPLVRQVLGEKSRVLQLRKARELLQSGQLPAAKWAELVETGAFKLSKPRRAARRAKLAADGLSKPPAGKVLHHYMPLEFEPNFLRVGLDPNDPQFTVWVDVKKHAGWHSVTPRGGYFNDEWRRFFVPGQPKSASEILAEFSRLSGIYIP